MGLYLYIISTFLFLPNIKFRLSRKFPKYNNILFYVILCNAHRIIEEEEK